MNHAMTASSVRDRMQALKKWLADRYLAFPLGRNLHKGRLHFVRMKTKDIQAIYRFIGNECDDVVLEDSNRRYDGFKEFVWYKDGKTLRSLKLSAHDDDVVVEFNENGAVIYASRSSLSEETFKRLVSLVNAGKVRYPLGWLNYPTFLGVTSLLALYRFEGNRSELMEYVVAALVLVVVGRACDNLLEKLRVRISINEHDLFQDMYQV